MKTLFSVFLLIVYGVAANFLAVFILNIAGLPGVFLAGKPGTRSKGRFIFGSLVSAIGQSYVYLCYVAFIVSWTRTAGARSDVFSPVLWPVAFFAVLIPIWITMIRARAEARQSNSTNPQVEALPLTAFVGLSGFIIFAVMPSLMRTAWGWVPYVK